VGGRGKYLRESKSFNCTWNNKSLLSLNQLRNFSKSGRQSVFTARSLKSAEAEGKFGISYHQFESRQKSLHICLLYTTRYIIPHPEVIISVPISIYWPSVSSQYCVFDKYYMQIKHPLIITYGVIKTANFCSAGPRFHKSSPTTSYVFPLDESTVPALKNKIPQK